MVRPTGNPLPKLLVASVKMMVRDRRTVLLSLLVPVLFAVIFGLQDFGAAQHAKVTVVPAGSSAYAGTVVAGLRRDDAFRLTTSPTLAAARKRLSDGKTDVVLAVPRVPTTPLTVYYKPSGTNNDFAIGSLQRFVDALNLRLAGVTRPEVRLAQRSIEARDTNYYDFLLPGLIAMGVMNISIIGVAVAVTRYREQKILKRILATPLRPWSFLVGQGGARLAFSIVQVAIILAVGIAFGAHVHGNPAWIFVFAALGNLVFINLGLFVAGRARNVDAAQSMSQLIALPMLFLSGVFFTTGGGLANIVRVLPLTPLVTGLRKIMVDGASITQCGAQLALLVAWVFISLALARRSFSFDETTPRRFGLRAAAARVAR